MWIKKKLLFLNICTNLGGRGSDFNDGNLADRLPDTVQPVSKIKIHEFWHKKMFLGVIFIFFKLFLNNLQYSKKEQ